MKPVYVTGDQSAASQVLVNDPCLGVNTCTLQDMHGIILDGGR